MKATKLHQLAKAADDARKANSAAYTKWSKDQTAENDAASRASMMARCGGQGIFSEAMWYSCLVRVQDARACALRDLAVFCTELRANIKVGSADMGEYDRGSMMALELLINHCEKMLKEGWPK